MSLLPISLLYSLGCTAQMQEAPADATVQFQPESYTITMDPLDPGINQRGRVLMADVVVMQTNERTAGNSIPLEGIRVEITSLADSVYVIPQEAVELISFPGLPGNIQSYDDLQEACTDEQGNYSHSMGDYCAWYWDTRRNA